MSTGHSTTPVRLISQNGRFYELACTNVSIDIDRKVIAIPLPASGSERVTADLNLTNSVITLEGVITDGDAVLQSTGNSASATIDFSAVTGGEAFADYDTPFVTSIINYARNPEDTTPFTGYFNPTDVGVVNDDKYRTVNTIELWKGTITGGEKNTFKIFLGVNDSATGFDTTATADEYILSYHDGTSPKTAEEMATGLYNLITAQITTMSANILTGSNGGNTKVELRFTNVPSGNTYTNTVDYPRMNFLTYEPVHTTFRGGFEATSSATAPYSAGDTVQQLYAILSNSQNRWRNSKHSGSHYIIGVQIPFLSATSTQDEKYLSRVMWTTAGFSTTAFTNKDIKFSSFAHTAGSDFLITDSGEQYSGMKVAVDKATFVQVGGEPNVYSFTILLIVTNHII
jgi:hypothetical protein